MTVQDDGSQRMLAWNSWLLVIHVYKCVTKLVYDGSSFCVLWFRCYSDMDCRGDFHLVTSGAGIQRFG